LRFLRIFAIGKVGKNGGEQRSYQPQNQDHLFATRSWHPHDTASDTFMRRRRWYGWQARAMTPDELRAHVESRLRCWIGRPDDASG
jgi:hypothetical protein